MSPSNLHVEERTFFRKFDVNLVIVLMALTFVIGLINLWSATHGIYDTETDRLFISQVFWLCFGWGVFFALTLMDYHFFSRIAYILYALNLIALVAVFAIGKTAYGAQRWLDLGFFRYQPSETMKLVLILVMAKVFSRKSYNNGMGFKELFLPTLILLLPFALVVRQPDLGTALMLSLISGTLFLFIGVRKSVLLSFVVIAVIAAPLVWNFGLKEYQQNRILTFLTPGRDPRGTGYNSIQSKIAVGSGRILGKGFRKGTQSQLEFLPERHTDFIYSVLSEEHGFIGSLATAGLFLLLLIKGIKIASQARDKFGALVAVGVMAYMFWHVSINIGMVIGLLPIVGVPLPLLSYGGSSMLTTMAGLGLLSSVAYRRYLF